MVHYLIRFLFANIEIFRKEIIMCRYKYLNTLSLQQQEHINNGWDVFGVQIGFRFIPQKNRTTFQSSVEEAVPCPVRRCGKTLSCGEGCEEKSRACQGSLPADIWLRQ